MNWPTEYNYVLRDVLKDVDARKAGALSSLAFAEEQEREVAAALSHVTLGILTTGIAELDDSTLPRVPFKWSARQRFDWVTYCKHVAHELRRPTVIVQQYQRFIYATSTSSVSTPNINWCVHISKREYARPLWAWFLLLPKSQIQGCTRYWRFYVYPEHQELVPAWREQCHNDLVFRKALRLNP